MRTKGWMARSRTGDFWWSIGRGSFIGGDNEDDLLSTMSCYYDDYYSEVREERLEGLTSWILVPVMRVEQADPDEVVAQGWMYDIPEGKMTLGMFCQCLPQPMTFPGLEALPQILTTWVIDPDRQEIPITETLVDERLVLF